MKRSIVAFATAILASAAWASAGPVYGFSQITSNGNTNVAYQLSVEVMDTGEVPEIGVGQVGFLFKNAVGIPSNVAEVYFDDGSLFGIASVYNSAGVTLTDLGNENPADLPGGNSITPKFDTTKDFSADIGNGDGIDATGESALIVFNLKNSKTYADTLAALVLGLTDGGNSEALRIGLHVRSIGTGGQSEAYVNTAVVPLPAAAWMGMALMGSVGGFGYLRKRRNLNQQPF